MAKTKNWSVGDVFAVPLADGGAGFGQVLSIEPQAMNSFVGAIYDVKASVGETPPLQKLGADQVLAVLFITRDLLDSGQWQVVARSEPLQPEKFVPLNSLRAQGFVGAKVIGSANVTRLLNAYFRLAPWNMMKDPEYFDRLLLPARSRPSDVILRSHKNE
jgi:hypothetical protein